MAFFQNPFHEEFRGNWVLGDRQKSYVRVVKPNAGRSPEVVQAFGLPPPSSLVYDLSGDDSNGVTDGRRLLTINFAMHDLTKYNAFTVDLVGIGSTSVTADDIVTALNADDIFLSYFVASNQNGRVTIRASRPSNFRFYVVNSGAEEVLKFNRIAGVNDLPLYFARHTVIALLAYEDCTGSLLQLSHKITCMYAEDYSTTITSPDHGLEAGDMIYVAVTPTDLTPVTYGPLEVASVIDVNNFTVGQALEDEFVRAFWAMGIDYAIIADAVDAKGVSLGFSLESGKEDWELLYGESGLFNFRNMVVDSSSRITQIIEYPTGSVPGNLAKKTNYSYTDDNTEPDSVTEVPYVLTADDLLYPVTEPCEPQN